MDTTKYEPGWYPDPTRRFDYRYWDGATWTGHVSKQGTSSVDPLPSTVPVVVEETTRRASPMVSREIRPVDARPGPLACRRASRAEAREGRDLFETLAMRAAAGDATALAALPGAVADARQHFRGSKFDKKRLQVLGSAVRAAINDDVLSVAEERHILNPLEALGVDLNALQETDRALWEELLIARVNGGRPPVVSNPGVLMKRGEVAHGVFAAALMKEVSVREWRGGSSGMSIPIGGGMQTASVLKFAPGSSSSFAAALISWCAAQT